MPVLCGPYLHQMFSENWTDKENVAYNLDEVSLLLKKLAPSSDGTSPVSISHASEGGGHWQGWLAHTLVT